MQQRFKVLDAVLLLNLLVPTGFCERHRVLINLNFPKLDALFDVGVDPRVDTQDSWFSIGSQPDPGTHSLILLNGKLHQTLLSFVLFGRDSIGGDIGFELY